MKNLEWFREYLLLREREIREQLKDNKDRETEDALVAVLEAQMFLHDYKNKWIT